MILSKESYSRRYAKLIWDNPKDPFNTKNYYKGQHGSTLTRRKSNFSEQMTAKQIMRFHYAVQERQFANTFKKAAKLKGNVIDNFGFLLESRLMSIIYRSNLAPSIFNARQIISHGHVRVNGKKVNIPSYKVKLEDVVEIDEFYRKNKILDESFSQLKRQIPDYLEIDKENYNVKMVRKPAFSEIPFPTKIKISFIVEYYSRRL